MPKDEIPPVKNDTYYIINLENHNQPGSHWVLLYIMQRKIIYFDPFGALPPSAVVRWADKCTKMFQYGVSRVDIQGFNTPTCGYYCIELARKLNRRFEKNIRGFPGEYGTWDDIIRPYRQKTPAENDKEITERWQPIVKELGITN